jgi:HSP20 family molecular chaperone IbpA
VIKTIVAGVKPEDLDISISRDMVTIRGKREEVREVSDEDYFHRELYWGSFSRTILLPEEIDVEAAEASERHGLLTVRLPKSTNAAKPNSASNLECFYSALGRNRTYNYPLGRGSYIHLTTRAATRL